MSYWAEEIDPKVCQFCERPLPGSGHWRAVNSHQTAESAFHCDACGHHIGKRRSHMIDEIRTRVLCVACWEKEDGSFPWRFATRAAAMRIMNRKTLENSSIDESSRST